MKPWLEPTFRQAAWAPMTVFLGYALLTNVTPAESRLPWLDIPAHFLGGMAIAYFMAVGLANAQSSLGPIPKVVRRAACLGLTAVTALVWEFLEYAADVLFATRFNHGVADTLSDLFFGLAGASTAIALLSARWQRSSRTLKGEGKS